MLHQDCVLNLPQNSLPPKQPGFQPTKHRTSCQSVFATLIIRVGSRKRHSAGSPHFAVCQGEPNSGSPSSTKNMAGAKISEVAFVAVVPCGPMWSLGLNGPRDPCTDPKRSMLGALAMRLNSSRSWPRERQSDIEYVEQFRVYQQ